MKNYLMQGMRFVFLPAIISLVAKAYFDSDVASLIMVEFTSGHLRVRLGYLGGAVCIIFMQRLRYNAQV